MRRFFVLAFVAGVGLIGSIPGFADGVDSLGESYRITLVGGGVASDGVGLAGRTGGPASGTISISGVPASASVKRAFLYWSILAGTDPGVDFAGQPVLGTEIGRSPDPCWENIRTVDPSKDSRSYRADVTSRVAGNGSYSIAGVGGGGGLAGDGTGASLVVIYEDASAEFQTTIIVNDGSLTAGIPGAHQNSISHTFGSLPASAPILGAALHVGIGDGQPEFGEGGMTLGNAEVLPANALDGSDGPSWDDRSLAPPASLFGSSTFTISNALETTSDCLVWVYAALALRQDRSVGPPPSVTVSSPINGAVIPSSTVTITGSSSGAASIRLSEGQNTLTTTGVDQQGAWSAQVTLPDGSHSITVSALNASNVPVAVTTVQFTVSGGPPPPGPVEITQPANNSVVTSTAVSFAGTASSASSIRLERNGAAIATAPVSDGAWSAGPITFPEGGHQVTAVPLDTNGNPAGGFTFVEFGVDTGPPSVEMREPEFPSPPFGNVQINIGHSEVQGSASDGLAVARVVVAYNPVGSLNDPETVEANCGGCTPSFCRYCGNPSVQWWAELDVSAPGVYEVTATAYDLAGRSATTPSRTFVQVFDEGGPGGLFDGPPNCFGPLEETPVCFDPFEDGPFGEDGPLCIGPVKDLFCSGEGDGSNTRRR